MNSLLFIAASLMIGALAFLVTAIRCEHVRPQAMTIAAGLSMGGSVLVILANVQ